MRFVSESDIEHVNKNNSRIFEKRVLVVRPAPACVRVSGIPPSTTEDTLRLYFESKRSGADKNDAVAFVHTGRETAIVGFYHQDGKTNSFLDLQCMIHLYYNYLQGLLFLNSKF